MSGNGTPTVDSLVADLADAADRYATLSERIDDHGEEHVESVAAAYDEATDLLDRYVESATGSGDFESYLRFQDEFATLVEELDEDVPHRDAFERALDAIDKRRLSESDFEAAHDELAPAADVAALPAARAEAREDYREARDAIERRIDALDDRIDDLTHLQSFGDADFDADTDVLRDPITAYNDAVHDAFDAFRSDASARRVLEFVADTESFPLVGYRTPPADLLDYVRTHPEGEKPIPRLLELSEFSGSKLDHYVDDPNALRSAVATRQTYLERLDADPLTVAWPPIPAEALRYRCRELIQVTARIPDEYADDVVATLRTVRDLTRESAYDTLRDAAAAREQLSDEERNRLQSGAVARDLEECKRKRSRLTDALDEYPPL